VTVPWGEKSSRRSLSAAEKERLPTYNFINITTFVTEPFSNTEFQITTEEAHLTIYRAIN
jgi:hypothetical protein